MNSSKKSFPRWSEGSVPNSPLQESLILGLAALFPGGGFMAFPEGAGRDDPQWEAWFTAMLPRLWLP